MQKIEKTKLIIICGLAYAGKTTLGKAVVKRSGYATVDVDVTKEQLYGKGFNDDDLTPEQWVKIYNETDKQIENYLKEGKSVVDESRNFSKSERVNAKEIAKKCGSDFILVYVNTPEKIVRQRHIENRENPTRHDVKDKDFEEIIKNFEPPTVDENPIIFNQTDNISQWISNLLSH